MIQTEEPNASGFDPTIKMGGHGVTSGNQAEDGEAVGAVPAPASAMHPASAAQVATPSAGQGPTIWDAPDPIDADMSGVAGSVSDWMPPQNHDQGRPAQAPEYSMGGAEGPTPSTYPPASAESDDADMEGWWPSLTDPMTTPMPTTTAQAHQGHQVAPGQGPLALIAANDNDQQQQAPLIKGYLLDVCERMQDLVAPLATAENQAIGALELHSLLEEAMRTVKANGADSREKLCVVHAYANATLRDAKQAIDGAEQALGSKLDQLTISKGHSRRRPVPSASGRGRVTRPGI